MKFKENLIDKLEDIWLDIKYVLPRVISEFFWNIRRYIRNIIRYRNVLAKDNDFDSGYFEDLILTKLKFMAEYFRTARIVVGEERIYQEVCWAIRLGNIAFDKEDILEYTGYVNLRDIKKYFPKLTEENMKRIEEDSRFGCIMRTELRRRKSRRLFFRLLEEHEWNWAD